MISIIEQQTIIIMIGKLFYTSVHAKKDNKKSFKLIELILNDDDKQTLIEIFKDKKYIYKKISGYLTLNDCEDISIKVNAIK